MSRRWCWGRLLLLAVLASLALAGCNFTYAGFTIDCTQFRIVITSGSLTVDNSGSGDEIIGVRAVDGAGNSLYYNPLWHSNPVGSAFKINSGHVDTFAWTNAPRYNPITVTYFNPAGGVLTHEIEIASFTGICPGLPNVSNEIGDGRLNRYDLAAPVAVFPIPAANGTGLHLYAIGADGAGTLALVVTPEMIEAVPELPEMNTLIAATPDGAIALYRLTTGEFQINAGTYVIVFRDLIPTAEYYIP